MVETKYKVSFQEYKEANNYIVSGVEESTLLGPPGQYPTYLKKGKGQYVWDVDNNQYIDYLCGFGPIILGHADDDVTSAISKAIENGIQFGISNSMQNRLSEMLINIIPCAEKIRYFSTGSEACEAAIRIARMYTEKKHVLTSGYHGWILNRNLSNIHYAKNEQTIHDFGYDYEKALFYWNLYKNDICCVFIEPDLRIHNVELLKKLQVECNKRDCLFIFDEIKTCFRLAMGGVQSLYQIIPDVSVHGKAMANGFPLSCVVGRDRFMSVIEEIWTADATHRFTIPFVAAIATIQKLSLKESQEKLNEIGNIFYDKIKYAIKKFNIPSRLAGVPRMPHMIFEKQHGRYFYIEMAKRGYILHLERWYYTLSHTKEDIIDTMEAMQQAWRGEYTIYKYIQSTKKMLLTKNIQIDDQYKIEKNKTSVTIKSIATGKIIRIIPEQLITFFENFEDINNIESCINYINTKSDFISTDILLDYLMELKDDGIINIIHN